MHSIRTSSTVGSKARRYFNPPLLLLLLAPPPFRALECANCHFEYCCSNRSPMISFALFRLYLYGSIQHCNFAQGCGFIISGASVPIFNAMIKPTPTVFIRSRNLQSGTISVRCWWVCSDVPVWRLGVRYRRNNASA